jgi:hypothetical protein
MGSYQLRATSGGLYTATSASFTITAGPAALLVFGSSPSSATSATTFSTTPTVTVRDAGGNAAVTAGQATLALTNPGGATLRCTTNPVSGSGSVYSFSGCSIDKAGSYTLTATLGSLTAAVSPSFTVAPGAASKLIFITSPSGGAVNQVWGTQPRVAIQDASGNTVNSYAAVTLRLTTPAGATLTCQANPLGAVAGAATYSGCRTNRTGTYTLTASSGTLAPGVSATFTIP